VKRYLLVLSAGVLGAAALWPILAGTPDRIPPGWEWRSSFVGTQTWPDPESGSFPERDVPGIYTRAITIEDEAGRPDSVVLKDDYVIRDPVTEEVTWRYTVYPRVDPATGSHLDPEHREDFVVFPREVERRPYRIRMNYIEGVRLDFLKEEVVEGLEVYVFGYKGRGEYTDSYLETADFPGIPVAAGQEIKCADDQFIFVAWVEPLTGEAVKMLERCDSGDYLFNASTGEPISPILRWGGNTTGIDVFDRVDLVRRERLRTILDAIAT
jgi:hypothetical protein